MQSAIERFLWRIKPDCRSPEALFRCIAINQLKSRHRREVANPCEASLDEEGDDDRPLLSPSDTHWMADPAIAMWYGEVVEYLTRVLHHSSPERAVTFGLLLQGRRHARDCAVLRHQRGNSARSHVSCARTRAAPVEQGPLSTGAP